MNQIMEWCFAVFIHSMLHQWILWCCHSFHCVPWFLHAALMVFHCILAFDVVMPSMLHWYQCYFSGAITYFAIVIDSIGVSLLVLLIQTASMVYSIGLYLLHHLFEKEKMACTKKKHLWLCQCHPKNLTTWKRVPHAIVDRAMEWHMNPLWSGSSQTF